MHGWRSFERAQRLLGAEGLPPALRAQAWAVHAEACLLVGAAASDDLRVSLRYAAKHLGALAPTGARVADVVARAPPAPPLGSSAGCLDASGPILEGLCGVEWPLRIAGLVAAAAAAEQPGAPAEVAEIASGAMLAFTEEYGGSPLGATADSFTRAKSYRAKRRRLLKHIVRLRQDTDDNDTKGGDADGGSSEELARLCAEARVCIDVWAARCQVPRAPTH